MKRPIITLVTIMLVSMKMPAQPTQIEIPKPDRIRISKSDGCSMFSDGDYGECCVAHDREYQLGGTAADRKAADEQLYRCVRAKGHKYLSRVMWIGVRFRRIRILQMEQIEGSEAGANSAQRLLGHHLHGEKDDFTQDI